MAATIKHDMILIAWLLACSTATFTSALNPHQVSGSSGSAKSTSTAVKLHQAPVQVDLYVPETWIEPLNFPKNDLTPLALVKNRIVGTMDMVIEVLEVLGPRDRFNSDSNTNRSFLRYFRRQDYERVRDVLERLLGYTRVPAYGDITGCGLYQKMPIYYGDGSNFPGTYSAQTSVVIVNPIASLKTECIAAISPFVPDAFTS